MSSKIKRMTLTGELTGTPTQTFNDISIVKMHSILSRLGGEDCANYVRNGVRLTKGDECTIDYILGGPCIIQGVLSN